jgi:hypothetical protein
MIKIMKNKEQVINNLAIDVLKNAGKYYDEYELKQVRPTIRKFIEEHYDFEK